MYSIVQLYSCTSTGCHFRNTAVFEVDEVHNGRLGTWRRLGTWPQRYRALALVPSGAVERVGFSGIAEDRVFVLARTRAGRTHGLKLRLVGAEVPRASSRTFGNC